MSTGKRLAKRSILGTRVSVKLTQDGDGLYYPGIIQASRSEKPGFNVYSVLLENKTVREFAEKEIIGPGFQPMSTVTVMAGQVVFITHNGREVSGRVMERREESDEVTVCISGVNDQKLEVIKRTDEVRLLESRKSARLQDLDQDYSRLADFGNNESRKRATSSGIDVPHTHGNRKRRPSSSSDVDVMDDCAAAMVLMSLSCSPKSPRLPGYLSEASGFFASRSWTESSSSGASSWQSGQRTGTPSPPHLSESAPSSSTSSTGTSHLNDEGIEVDEPLPFTDDPLPRKRRSPTRTAFRCTWPGCKMVTSQLDTIEKHVRLVHLGRSDSDSDNEEEFYYTEVEINVDAVVEALSGMHTSSPPNHMDLSHLDMVRSPYEDPEYQKMLQSSPMKQAKPGNRLLTASPKPSPLRHRKCRKVYGMENRDMWCTQCKWKKACSRFNADSSLPLV